MSIEFRPVRIGYVIKVLEELGLGVARATVTDWIKDGGLRLENPDQSGWTEFTEADVLTVGAWAYVVNRVGISPRKQENPLGWRLAYTLAGTLESMATGEPVRRYVKAEVFPGDGKSDPRSKAPVNHATYEEVVEALNPEGKFPELTAMQLLVIDAHVVFTQIKTAMQVVAARGDQ